MSFPELIVGYRLFSLYVVQVGYPAVSSKSIQSVAICAGSGGSMLLGRDADVYFTGEMSHVGLYLSIMPLID